MKIKDLIEKLAEYPEDYDIILSKDEEGNGYISLYCIEEGYFEGEDFYHIEDLKSEFDGLIPPKCNCITLFP